MSSRSNKYGRIDHLPVEVIGHILSRLHSARDVILASVTCRKWREAYRQHLHTLQFQFYENWPVYNVYNKLPTSSLEMLITRTIFQTTGLQDLLIVMPEKHKFSATAVVAWLMYSRKTLRKLFYDVKTDPIVIVLDFCGKKLEVLILSYNSITKVQPDLHRFPCLRSLFLNRITISPLDLKFLLAACPKIETLELRFPNFTVLDNARIEVELCSSTLKTIIFKFASSDNFILKADGVESLYLKNYSPHGLFELINQGSLKRLKIEQLFILGLHTEPLEY